jgi:hypothetical protein
MSRWIPNTRAATGRGGGVLPGGDHQRERLVSLLGGQMQLGGPPASRPPECVISRLGFSHPAGRFLLHIPFFRAPARYRPTSRSAPDPACGRVRSCPPPLQRTRSTQVSFRIKGCQTASPTATQRCRKIQIMCIGHEGMLRRWCSANRIRSGPCRHESTPPGRAGARDGRSERSATSGHCP